MTRGSRRLTGLIVLLLSLTPAWVEGGAGGRSGADDHDLHETYADLAIEDATLAGRLQFFRKDLERALGPLLQSDAVALTPGAETDALVHRYVREHFQVLAHGDTLEPALIRAEAIELGHHPGWQITLAWAASAPIDELRVRNTLLFELHEDQRNVMRFVRFPEETRVTVTTEVGTEERVVSAPGDRTRR